jgi:hypothetical protein
VDDYCSWYVLKSSAFAGEEGEKVAGCDELLEYVAVV